MKALILSAAIVTVLAGPAMAQNCLFPIACPGPVPSKPEPLYGPPEDQASPEQPIQKAQGPKRHARKHAKTVKNRKTD